MSGTTTPNLAIEQLNEHLTRAKSEDAPISAVALGLLGAVVTGALAIAVLPELAAGVGFMAAIAAFGTGLTLAGSGAAAVVLSLDLMSLIRLHKEDLEIVEFVTAFSSSPYTIVGGTLGAAIDGEYGFETGATAGGLIGIMFDVNDMLDALRKLREEGNGFFSSTAMLALHSAVLAKEIKEMPSTAEQEHIFSRHTAEVELNATSMSRNLLEKPIRNPNPIVAPVTDRQPLSSSTDAVVSQIQLDRLIHGTPVDWLLTPIAVNSLPVPSPSPSPTPSPSPIPQPTLASAYPSLLPDYLGGIVPTVRPAPPPVGDAFLPDDIDWARFQDYESEFLPAVGDGLYSGGSGFAPDDVSTGSSGVLP